MKYYTDGDATHIDMDGAKAALTIIRGDESVFPIDPNVGYKRKVLNDLGKVAGLISMEASPISQGLHSFTTKDTLRAAIAEYKKVDSSFDPTLYAYSIVEVKHKEVLLSFPDAKALIGAFKLPESKDPGAVLKARNEWLDKAKKARVTSKEYLDYVPLTDDEIVELLGQ